MRILHYNKIWLLCGLLLVAMLTKAQNNTQLVIEPQGHSAKISDILFTPNGKSVISVSHDKTIRIWDSSSGELKKTIRGQIGDGSQGKIYSAALSPNGRLLVVGGFFSYGTNREYGAIRIIDLKRNEMIGKLTGHTDVVFSVAFSKDGRYIASGSGDKTIKIWEVNRKRLVTTLKGHSNSIYEVAFAPNGNQLISGSYDKTVKIWDWQNRQVIKTLTRHNNRVQVVAYSPNGRYFATGGYDKRIFLWDNKGNFLKEISTNTTIVKKIRFSRDSKKLLVAAKYQNIYSVPSADLLSSITKHKYATGAAFWGATGKYMATGGGDDKEVYVWNTQTGKVVSHVKGKGKPKYNVGFARKGSKVAFGNTWKSGSNKGPLTQAFDFTKMKLYTDGINPSDFRKALTLYKENTLTKVGKYKLKIKDELFIKNRSSVDGSIKVFTYTPNASRIILGNSFNMNLYSKKGKKLKQLVGHTSIIRGVSPSSDNKLMVSSSDDQTIRLWNIDAQGFSTSKKTLKTIAERFTHPSWPKAWKRNGLDKLINEPGIEPWLKAIVAFRKNNENTNANMYEAYLYKQRRIKVRPLATLFVATDNEWVCWTPQGYYAASAGGERYIGWHINRGGNKLGTYYPVATFRKKYYKPDLVKLIIKHGSFDKAMKLYNTNNVQVTENIVKKNENIMDHLPPKVEWVNPAEGDLKVKGKTFTVKARITSGSKITGVKLLVNGRAVAKTRGFEVVKNKSDKEKVLEYKVTLEGPETNLLVFASNTSSSTLSEARTLKREAGSISKKNNDDLEFDVKQNNMLKPNLYVVSVGVSDFKKQSYNLDYAHADAEAITALFKTQKGLLYKDVQVKQLTNKQATRANILDAFYWLEKNVTHKDVAILFIASHGFNEKGKFYILPHDGDPERLRSTAVNWADFQDVLGNLPSKVMLFLDACHSGALGDNLTKTRGAKVNNTEAIREITSAEHGVIVMSASTGSESSLEQPDWKHGAFTYALLKAMVQKKADFNNDGIVYLRELDFFVADEVKTLTKGKQHPTTLKPSTISRMPLVQVRK
ncbi:caspase family protein [uncultured Microscilla sp.]|uniref:caspase family protein n=1 Tax=uncultured Microscilla sp. TaxID=432653 RepID=UPI002614A75C|nr:caspase family protein [uncultured Microscilla sp.]